MPTTIACPSCAATALLHEEHLPYAAAALARGDADSFACPVCSGDMSPAFRALLADPAPRASWVGQERAAGGARRPVAEGWRSARYRVRLPITCGGYQGEVLDLSRGGLKAILPSPFPVRSQVPFVLTVGPHAVRGEAQVMWADAQPREDSGVRHGMRFTKMTREAGSLIEGYLRSL